MKVYHMPQASPEWWEIRRGRPTASEFHHLISGHKKRNGVEPYSLKPTGSTSYMNRLIGDVACLTPNYFTEREKISRSRETQYGKETEDEARRWLAMHTGRTIDLVGHITNDDGSLGCSPDGVTFAEGRRDLITEGYELKCPRRDIQAGYLLRPDEVPKQYVPQVHGSLIVTNLQRWHFCTYAPGLDPLFVIVEWNWYTNKLRAVLDEFLKSYHERLHKEFPDIGRVNDWREWLRTDPPLAEFNARLPEMSLMKYQLKRQVWHLVQEHAKAARLEFHEASKTFQPIPEPEVPF